MGVGGVRAGAEEATDLGATRISGAAALVSDHADAVHWVPPGRFLSRDSRAGLVAARFALGGSIGRAFA